jgi:hypothetical protein
VHSRDEYLIKAVVFTARAELIRNPQERAAMLTIAKGHLDLADYVGSRLERGTAHRDQSDQHPQNDS